MGQNQAFVRVTFLPIRPHPLNLRHQRSILHAFTLRMADDRMRGGLILVKCEVGGVSIGTR